MLDSSVFYMFDSVAILQLIGLVLTGIYLLGVIWEGKEITVETAPQKYELKDVGIVKTTASASYNSSIFGVGRSIPIYSISRCSQTGRD